MSRRDIACTIDDFATAAANAIRAGFDGVQVQAGYAYLISQFLNDATNHRQDEYGGTIANRARLLVDVIDAIAGRIDVNRVGVKAGPAWPAGGRFRSTADTLATTEYVALRLGDYPLSHWMLMGTMADLTDTPSHALQGDDLFVRFRPRIQATLIANVGFTQTRANRLIDDDTADLVALGEPFIANPDLPERFAAQRRSYFRTARRTTPPDHTDTPTIQRCTPSREIVTGSTSASCDARLKDRTPCDVALAVDLARSVRRLQ